MNHRDADIDAAVELGAVHGNHQFPAFHVLHRCDDVIRARIEDEHSVIAAVAVLASVHVQPSVIGLSTGSAGNIALWQSRKGL